MPLFPRPSPLRVVGRPGRGVVGVEVPREGGVWATRSFVVIAAEELLTLVSSYHELGSACLSAGFGRLGGPGVGFVFYSVFFFLFFNLSVGDSRSLTTPTHLGLCALSGESHPRTRTRPQLFQDAS